MGRVALAGRNDLNRGAPPQNNNATFNNIRGTRWYFNNLLIYDPDILQNNNIKITLGYTMQKYETSSRHIRGIGFPSDNIINFNQATDLNASSGGTEWALIAGFGRINYNYKGKYLAEFNFRREGSSRLSANNRYGIFPSGAVGWRLSKENFYPDNFFINNLLIRASVGKTGNNAIGNFESLARLSRIRYVLGDQVLIGKATSNLEPSGLRWETALQYQIGGTFGLFNNLITMKVAYYKKITKNMLFNVPIPRSTGFSSARMNIGQMENKGWDIGIHYSSKVSNDFQWSSNFNLSLMHNKVTKMPKQIEQIKAGGRGGTNITKEGYPVGSLYGAIRLGIFSKETINNPKWHPWQDAPKVIGTNAYKDLNGDGIVNFNDFTDIGSPHPTAIFGFSNQFSYKNFSLSVLFTGMFGYEVLQQYYDVVLNTVARYNVSTLELHRWKSPQEPGNGLAPRSEVNNGARQWMDDWLSPGGHVWIKNVRLNYNLPGNIVQTLGIQDMGFYVNINNLFRFDNYAGLNPEGSSSRNPLSSGRDTYVYPLSRLYTIGVKLTF